jgi:protein-disulfide isomerase
MQLLLPVGPNDHSQGPADAPVTLLEYGSYDCTHCRNAAHIVRSLQTEFDGQLRRVFRHFPRVTIHSLSALAAEAAEAAASQGKFWQMHEALLARRDTTSEGALLACATAVGLNLPRFLHDLEAHIYQERVESDFQGGLASGVVSTPTFFINGIQHEDIADIDVLRAAITKNLVAHSGESEQPCSTFGARTKVTSGIPARREARPPFNRGVGFWSFRQGGGTEGSHD